MPAEGRRRTPCAKAIITTLRAGPTAAGRRDHIQGLVRLYLVGRGEEGGFDDGIRTAVQAILASPEFIFRFERTPAGAAPDANSA